MCQQLFNPFLRSPPVQCAGQGIRRGAFNQLLLLGFHFMHIRKLPHHGKRLAVLILQQLPLAAHPPVLPFPVEESQRYAFCLIFPKLIRIFQHIPQNFRILRMQQRKKRIPVKGADDIGLGDLVAACDIRRKHKVFGGAVINKEHGVGKFRQKLIPGLAVQDFFPLPGIHAPAAAKKQRQKNKKHSHQQYRILHNGRRIAPHLIGMRDGQEHPVIIAQRRGQHIKFSLPRAFEHHQPRLVRLHGIAHQLYLCHRNFHFLQIVIQVVKSLHIVTPVQYQLTAAP